jgi:hypothetical protein
MNLEHAMSALPMTPRPTRTRLARHEFLRFADHRPWRLHAECGTLWVTLDGEPDDIELSAGSSRVFDGRATVTVGTLGGPAVLSAQALPSPPRWPARLRAAVSARMQV